MPLSAGDVVAGYTIVRPLGVGGMGSVYLVRHPRLPRLDAMKLLRSDLSADPSFTARFQREADVAAALSHRNLVPVIDRGEDAGHLWLSMQYIDGTDAEAELAALGGPMPAPRVAHIVSEVAAALDYAHEQHLVHRDVKPANILLARHASHEPEPVYLTDFGIAKSLDAHTRLTSTGVAIFTLDYASPEQIAGQEVGARSDQYSLGCVLMKLLTGAPPFTGSSWHASVGGHLGVPPPRPTDRVPWLAPGIDAVLARALAKDPAQRYPNCRAMAQAAAEALRAFPPPPDPPYQLTLVRAGLDGAPVTVGPVTTSGLGSGDVARVRDLVRHTRFFDLPEEITRPEDAPTSGSSPAASEPVMLRIDAPAGSHQVRADLTGHRPPELDELVRLVSALPPAKGAAPPRRPAPRGPAPRTAVEQHQPSRDTSPPVRRAGPLPPPAPAPTPVQPPAAPWPARPEAGGDPQAGLRHRTGRRRRHAVQLSVAGALVLAAVAAVVIVLVVRLHSDAQANAQADAHLIARLPDSVTAGCSATSNTDAEVDHHTFDARSSVSCDAGVFTLWNSATDAKQAVTTSSAVDGTCQNDPGQNTRVQAAWYEGDLHATLLCYRSGTSAVILWAVDGHPVSGRMTAKPDESWTLFYKRVLRVLRAEGNLPA